MEKPFFFALIGMLSLAVFSFIDLVQSVSDFGNSALWFLFPELVRNDFYFILSLFVVSIFFVCYRYKQIILFPILCTIFQIFYLSFVFSFTVKYCVNPVAYFEQKENIWFSKNYEKFKNYLINEYDCCGISINDSLSDECSRKKVWTCGRALARHKGRDVRERVWKQFSSVSLHISTMIILWGTYLYGELDEEAIFNLKGKSTTGYEQV